MIIIVNMYYFIVNKASNAVRDLFVQPEMVYLLFRLFSWTP